VASIVEAGDGHERLPRANWKASAYLPEQSSPCRECRSWVTRLTHGQRVNGGGFGFVKERLFDFRRRRELGRFVLRLCLGFVEWRDLYDSQGSCDGKGFNGDDAGGVGWGASLFRLWGSRRKSL